MKQILALIILFLALNTTPAQAHDHTEQSEAQILISMYQEDIVKSFERIQLLKNTILSPTVGAVKKCEYINELQKLLFTLKLDIQKYAVLPSNDDSSFYDEGASIRKIQALQMENNIATVQSIIPIFKKNNQCED